jgi:hypothetical protein
MVLHFMTSTIVLQGEGKEVHGQEGQCNRPSTHLEQRWHLRRLFGAHVLALMPICSAALEVLS